MTAHFGLPMWASGAGGGRVSPTIAKRTLRMRAEHIGAGGERVAIPND
jgi:hypothetical protein